jgi:small nuclear ribonucleoprotein (snRNP)-like protein
LNKLNIFKNFKTNQEEKRKKFVEEFRTNCKENKKMLKTIAKNTESKLKNYLQKEKNIINEKKEIIIEKNNNRKGKGRLHSVDYKGKLDTESVIIHTSSAVREKSSSKSKLLLKYKTKNIFFSEVKQQFEKNKLHLGNRTLPDLPLECKSNLTKLKI